MSNSESEEEFVSIIATRERRSNAGSRMRQLLDMEEMENDSNAVLNDDDENVNLLFQEDEDDDEFQESEEEGEIFENESEEGDEKNQRGVKRQREANDEDGREDEEESNNDNDNDDDDDGGSPDAVDSDVMLSDSDISASDSDESEGERELKQQEKNSKRKKRKQHLTKKQPSQPKTSRPKAKPKSRELSTELPIERRQSVRQTTLESSIALQEKLKDEKEKKQSIKPVVRKEHIEKTLEERLEEAKITEQENTLSLSLFFEQELERKKRQRELANARKYKLKEFVRIYSSGVYITPLEEVEFYEEEQRLIQIEEEKRLKRKQQYQKRKQMKLIKDAKAKGLPIPEFKNEEMHDEIGDISVPDNKEIEIDGKDKGEDQDQAEGKYEDQVQVQVQVQDEMGSKVQDQAQNQGQVQDQVASKVEDQIQDQIASKVEDQILDESEGQGCTEGESEGKADGKMEPEQGVENEDKDQANSNQKSVTFAPGAEITEIDFAEPPTSISKEYIEEVEHDQRIYEGPSQLAAYQYVSFEEFKKPPSMDFIKKSLFGSQSLLLTRRDPNFKTLEVITADHSSTIDLKKIQDARTSQFEALLKLPKFGEKYTEVISFDDGEDKDNLTVRITTPSPAGISLANGQRKKCLISGGLATYYDPNNGLPYASVECFKILKKLTENGFSWCQVDNGGINSRFKHGVGCYLKEIGQRHAKGVPKGFE